MFLAAVLASAAAGISGARGDGAPAPSSLLPYLNGASPYSGIGRYEGRATCTAFLLDTSGPVPDGSIDPPAYAVTSGHCPMLPGANDVILGQPGLGRVVFNFFADGDRWQVPVPVARTAYATMKGRDIAVLELAPSYLELTRRQIRPWRVAASPPATHIGDPIAVIGAPLWPDIAGSFLRIANCRLDGVAPLVLERTWHWFDVPFHRCRDMLPGASGSPVISTIDGEVIALVGTTTSGAPPLTECSLNPCEPVRGGVRTQPDTTYGTALTGLPDCFNVHRRFDVHEPRCPLDPGSAPAATPAFIGPVNPLHHSQLSGASRHTVDIELTAREPFYRFAIVTPPQDDCRTTSQYSAPLSAAEFPSIRMPLPATEGFVLLCVVGDRGDGARMSTAHPTIVVARTDLTPPRVAPQMAIFDRDEAWHVRFRTLGDELTFYAYKVGPPMDTHCSDPKGYSTTTSAEIGLPKSSRPYVVCAIPYDAARNSGRLFERVLF
jgi:hypothetical protein